MKFFSKDNEAMMATDTADEQQLAQLGYSQELKREWGPLQNFGASFSIISVITGLTTLFGTGLADGGPAVMSIGWIIVCFFTFMVGLAMAEIVSAVPTSGGPYYWAAILTPKRWSPFFAWLTGWFNFLGQVAVSTGITFGLAGLISTLATVKTNYTPSAGKTIGIYAALITSHAMINTLGVKLLKYFNNSSIFLHSVGVSCICIAVLAKAPTHQSAHFVFQTFVDNTGLDDNVGWSIRASSEYVAIIGILMSQYTITGFDASAHMSEETHNAPWSAPIGVITSIGVSAIFGFFVILSFLFSIQDFDRTVNSPYGQPVLQIFVDTCGEDGAIVLMTLIIICVWHCGLFSIASNSRMMYGFARDGGLPSFFNHVDDKFHAPVRTIWLAAFLAFCLALPSLGSSVAFSAATSIATVGLYISYSLPILCALLWPTHFYKGPFTLGVLSKPIAALACLWVGFITIIFCLPTSNPVTSQTLNYTCVCVGIVGGGAILVWIVTARKWFKGPRGQVEADLEELADEDDGYAHTNAGRHAHEMEMEKKVTYTEGSAE